jgi:hypothetical protein
MITMKCQPEQNQGDSPIQISARKEEHQGSAGLTCAQRSPAVIAASGPMVQGFPLSGSPVRPNDICTEPEFLP